MPPQACWSPCRARFSESPTKAKSTSGASPLTMRAMRLARTAGVRPAQRAVAGVEEQVGQLARPMIGTLLGVAGRRPVQNCACAASPAPGKSCSTRLHDGLAAHAVQVAVVAVELGRAGDAQAVAQRRSREHQLVLVVGQRHLVRHRRRPSPASSPSSPWPGRSAAQMPSGAASSGLKAAHGQHVGVGAQALEAALAVGGSTWSICPPASRSAVTVWLIRNCTPSASQRCASSRAKRLASPDSSSAV
jgi:hypothetical protein